nr:IPT/TIG domain-containing protein [uncultured Chryseobacterium sp.]
MKNLNLKNFIKVFLLFLTATLWSACSNDDNEENGTSNPSIEFVAASVNTDGSPSNLTPTTVGFANNTYIIRGKGFSNLKNIYFNNYESYFNPTLVTDNNIIVSINEKTPYSNVNNKLKLVTASGTVEYDFVIAPPAPLFNGFQSINAADGSSIIIKGNYFVNPMVKVGDTQATIVSSTLTQITATLPAGSQGKKVSVTTLSGTVTYSSQVGTSIYDDIFYGGVTNSTWAGDTYNIAYSTDAANIMQGDKAIKWNAKAFSAFQIDNSPSIPANAKGIRFYAKAKTAGATNGVRLILNYSWTTTPSITIGEVYKYYEIPFTGANGFGLSATPSTMNLTLNHNTGVENEIYLDDIGYYY